MFKDEPKRDLWDRIRQQDIRQFDRFLTPALLRDAATQANLRWGAGALNLSVLLWLGLASAFHTAQNFAGVLKLTLKLLQDDGQSFAVKPNARRCRKGRHCRKGQRSKHDPRGADATSLSEEAFTQARRLMPAAYWTAVILLLGRAFESRHGSMLRWKNYRLLALDGTCVDLPNIKALANHFGTSANSLGRQIVQGRLVMLQFPLTRLPWRYELGGLDQGERAVAARLLRHLQPDDLLLMDRGFWSYGLFWQVQAAGAFFAVRLYPGVKFKTIGRLGERDRLVSWSPADRQWKKAKLPSSITLRVIDYQVKGFRPSAVVTNLTDPRQVSSQDWVNLSTTGEPGRLLDRGLYHRRWEIETTFCELKVRQGMERKLRSRTPEGIAYEIAGHVVLYLLVRWLMVEAALEHGQDPLRLSFLEALRETLDMSQTLLLAQERRVRGVLLPTLLKRIASHLVPWRPGREHPRRYDQRIKNKGNGKYRMPAKLII